MSSERATCWMSHLRQLLLRRGSPPNETAQLGIMVGLRSSLSRSIRTACRSEPLSRSSLAGEGHCVLLEALQDRCASSARAPGAGAKRSIAATKAATVRQAEILMAILL